MQKTHKTANSAMLALVFLPFTIKFHNVLYGFEDSFT